MKTAGVLLLAALIATPAPVAAQAFRGFAGNLAMSRVTMQPVDAQRRRNLAGSQGRFVTTYGARPAYGAPMRYRSGGSLSPAMRARVVAAVRRAYLQRLLANSTRYRALATR